MNIAFVGYHHFQANGTVHVFNLANALVELGHHCAVIVPDSLETVHTIGTPLFSYLTYADACAGALKFPDGRGPDIIHGWTPREGVRQTIEALVERYRCPYVIHLEDNEQVIAASQLGSTWDKLTKLSMADLDAAVGKGLTHPLRYRPFLERAAGMTLIIDRLFEFKPDNVPGILLWPAFEANIFKPQPADLELRRSLNIPDGNFLVVYPGNSHPANAAEIRSLYLAIAAVNRRRIPVTLLRIGSDYADFLGTELREVRRHVVELGRWEARREVIAQHLALADVLIQPGRPDAFNDYRFPSKLPEFFGMGKPVILPKSNIGHHVRDGVDGVLLHEGSALELAEKLEAVLRDPERRTILGENARAFAGANFSWRKGGEKLAAFYQRLCGASRGA